MLLITSMMTGSERRAAFASVWVLALAFGWIEATTVVYLREAARPGVAVVGPQYLPYVPTPVVSLPGALVALEMAREACTLILLAAAAWLAGRRAADRIGTFLLTFGIWDLTYYAVLRTVVGWPDRVGSWDILFLIPSPWLVPAWVPMTVATLFVIGGSYLFWTADRRHRGAVERKEPWVGVRVRTIVDREARSTVEADGIVQLHDAGTRGNRR